MAKKSNVSFTILSMRHPQEDIGFRKNYDDSMGAYLNKRNAQSLSAPALNTQTHVDAEPDWKIQGNAPSNTLHIYSTNMMDRDDRMILMTINTSQLGNVNIVMSGQYYMRNNGCDYKYKYTPADIYNGLQGDEIVMPGNNGTQKLGFCYKQGKPMIGFIDTEYADAGTFKSLVDMTQEDYKAYKEHYEQKYLQDVYGRHALSEFKDDCRITSIDRLMRPNEVYDKLRCTYTISGDDQRLFVSDVYKYGRGFLSTYFMGQNQEISGYGSDDVLDKVYDKAIYAICTEGKQESVIREKVSNKKFSKDKNVETNESRINFKDKTQSAVKLETQGSNLMSVAQNTYSVVANSPYTADIIEKHNKLNNWIFKNAASIVSTAKTRTDDPTTRDFTKAIKEITQNRINDADSHIMQFDPDSVENNLQSYGSLMHFDMVKSNGYTYIFNMNTNGIDFCPDKCMRFTDADLEKINCKSSMGVDSKLNNTYDMMKISRYLGRAYDRGIRSTDSARIMNIPENIVAEFEQYSDVRNTSKEIVEIVQDVLSKPEESFEKMMRDKFAHIYDMAAVENQTQAVQTGVTTQMTISESKNSEINGNDCISAMRKKLDDAIEEQQQLINDMQFEEAGIVSFTKAVRSFKGNPNPVPYVKFRLQEGSLKDEVITANMSRTNVPIKDMRDIITKGSSDDHMIAIVRNISYRGAPSSPFIAAMPIKNDDKNGMYYEPLNNNPTVVKQRTFKQNSTLTWFDGRDGSAKKTLFMARCDAEDACTDYSYNVSFSNDKNANHVYVTQYSDNHGASFFDKCIKIDMNCMNKSDDLIRLDILNTIRAYQDKNIPYPEGYSVYENIKDAENASHGHIKEAKSKLEQLKSARKKLDAADKLIADVENVLIEK